MVGNVLIDMRFLSQQILEQLKSEKYDIPITHANLHDNQVNKIIIYLHQLVTQ
jgi:hypothetical protein